MKPTIIVVEDELIIAMDIKYILEKEGFNVIINITNLNDTIQAILDYNPVLILLDINLKQNDCDGITIGQYLLIKDLIPFLFITSYSDKSTIERMKNTRPHGVIVKPFKPSDITTTIAVVLNNYQHKNIDVLRQNKRIDSNVPFALKSVVGYINDNIDNRIDLQKLSEFTSWNYMHFIRMFSKYMNVTPYQYILQKKIEKAAVQISESDLQLYHIAEDLSFSSYSNFCTVFKRQTGKSPADYRKISKVKEYL